MPHMRQGPQPRLAAGLCGLDGSEHGGECARAIAVLGIFSSLLLAAGSLYFMVFPERWAMAYMMPMGLYEVGLGIWLLVRGLREPAGSAAAAA